MHRFFLTEEDQKDDLRIVVLSHELVNQFVKVLRFRLSERVIFLDNTGFEFESEIVEMKPGCVVCDVLEKRFCSAELPFRLVVAQSILKNPDKFEWVLQKGTELGVSEFLPMITERTERKSLFKVDRMARILREAAEQSGRGIVPELSEVVKFEKIFENCSDCVFIVPDPRAEKTYKHFIEDFKVLPKKIIVCVGPEGGFTEQEINFAKERGAFLLNLGPRILRSETAGIVVSGLLGQL